VTNEGVLDDQVLSFGAMQMGVGNSLFVDGNDAVLSVSSVNKQWVHINGQVFLIESLPWTAISNQVGQLHPASNLNPKRGSVRRLAFLDRDSTTKGAKGDHKQEAMKVAQTETGGKGLNSTGGNGGNGEVRMPGTGVRRDFNTKGAKGAKRDIKEAAMKTGRLEKGGKRLVLDYNLSGTSSNLTLQGDTTYFVSSTVNITNLLCIKGGSVARTSLWGTILARM
jgi:hypothetical protein